MYVQINKCVLPLSSYPSWVKLWCTNLYKYLGSQPQNHSPLSLVFKCTNNLFHR